jgi:hypothetical protein
MYAKPAIKTEGASTKAKLVLLYLRFNLRKFHEI